MRKIRELNHIKQVIIHGSATPNGRDDDITDVDSWHSERTPPFKRDLSVTPNHANLPWTTTRYFAVSWTPMTF